MRFEELLIKESNNYVVENIENYISDELADIGLILDNENIPEEVYNIIMDKINNSLNYIKSQRMESLKNERS